VNDEKAIRAEMRLWALELLVSNLFAIICASDPEWVELFERTRRQMIEGAGQRIFPEVTDPPLFHLYADELEDAVTRLMDMVGEQMRHGRASGATL
jgi:hypothetical protein